MRNYGDLQDVCRAFRWVIDNWEVVKNETSFISQLSGLDSDSHTFIAKYPGALGNSLQVSLCPHSANDSAFTQWAYKNEFDAAPGTSDFATKNNAGSSANRLTINSEGSLQHKSGSGVSYFNGAGEYVFGSASSSPASGGNEGYVQIQAAKSRATFSLAGYANNAGAPFMQFLSSRSATEAT